MKRNGSLIRSALVLITAAMLLFSMFLVGCARVIDDCSDELCMYSWSAEYDNGVVISLSFDGDFATLRIAAKDTEPRTLHGLCVLSLTDFVICDEDTEQNFSFSYVVHGETLELSYGGATLILDKVYQDQPTS